MEASHKGKTEKKLTAKKNHPPQVYLLTAAVVFGATALPLPGCQLRRHPLPSSPSTCCTYRHGESLTTSS